MNWYIQAIKNYVNFSGRARRKEYWMFVLFNVIFGTLAAIIDKLIGSDLSFMGNSMGSGIVGLLYSLFVTIPSFALEFRRLHDINKSGWWIFIAFVPVIGWLWLLIYTLRAGTVGDNDYGTDPKAA